MNYANNPQNKRAYLAPHQLFLGQRQLALLFLGIARGRVLDRRWQRLLLLLALATTGLLPCGLVRVLRNACGPCAAAARPALEAVVVNENGFGAVEVGNGQRKLAHLAQVVCRLVHERAALAQHQLIRVFAVLQAKAPRLRGAHG